MLKLILNTLMLGGLTALSMSAQSFVQVSSVRALPSRLTCVGPGATTHIRVQVYVAGVPEAAKQSTMVVSLSVYAAHPSASKMDLREPSKQVALSESPAIVDFEVNCTAETLPGVMSLGVTVAEAPEGILIKEPAAPAVVDLKIERPH